MNKPKEFWIYHFKLNGMYFCYQELQPGKKTASENFDEIHVIEYSTYEQLKNKLDVYEDKVYHLSRRVEELEEELKMANDRDFV